MTTRRSKRLSSVHQNPTQDEEFTSGEKFLLELDQSVGRPTRSRRSSIGHQEVKPSTKARRQTMLPVVIEEKSITAASSKKQITLVSARKSRRLEAKKRSQTMLPAITLKKVEIKLRKIQIDPNLIFGLLKDSADKDRVESVEGKILKTKKKSSPVPRQRKAAVRAATPKTPKTKVEVKSSKKRKQTDSSVKMPVQNKSPKLDKTAGGSLKKTPTPLSKYKQKSPVGSLKKPLERLQVSKCTPTQVRPSDVLRRNMIRKVEKEIKAKLNKKPESSPYTLASAENSPVFRSVEDSVGPGTEVTRRVSSSTPVRPNRQEPHPMSPPPQMVTGKLGSLCSIM